MKPIHFAMIGGGRESLIGPVHVRAAHFRGQMQLVSGVFSSDTKRSQDSAKFYGLNSKFGFTNLEKLLEFHKSEGLSLDAVVIVTPNHMHYEYARDALKAGLHVICDKPLCHSVAEAKELQMLSKKKDRVFAVTYNYSGYPMVRQLRELVSDNKLGRIHSVRARYLQGWLSEELEKSGHKQASWRTDPRKSGPSGCFADIGTHAFQLCQFVLNSNPKDISAQLRRTISSRSLDDSGRAHITFEGDIAVDITASQVSQGYRNHFCIEVDGTEASAYWLQEKPEELVIRRNGRPDSREYRGQTADAKDPIKNSSLIPSGHPEGFMEAFANIYGDAANAIRLKNENKPSSNSYLPTIKDGLEGVRFINLSVKSSAEKGALARWDECE